MSIAARAHWSAARSTRRLFFWLAVAFALLAALTPTRVSGQVADPVDLKQIERAFQQVVQRVQPSVVGIRANRRFAASGGGETAADVTRDRVVLVNGSGAVLDADGLILTNEHVVQGADRIEVVFHDGRSVNASVVAADARSDLAVLRAPRSNLTPAQFCEWSQVQRGQWAIVLGNPFGLGADGRFSVSVGVISNLGRRLPGLGEVDDRLYSDMIQTTAAINPGNSGGPLFDVAGRMVGIVTAMHTRAADDDGVGFAIPLTPAKLRMIDRLRHGEAIEYGFIGVTARSAEPEERSAAGVAQNAGVIVQSLDASGAAAQAGVREGDFILRFNKETIDGPGRLAQFVGESPIGARVELEIRRGGQNLTIPVQIGRRDVDRVSWMRSRAILWRGLRLTDLTPESRQRLQIPADAAGVAVLDVFENSPGRRAELRVGDVIQRVGQAEVHDVLAFRDATRNKNGVIRLTLEGRGQIDVTP